MKEGNIDPKEQLVAMEAQVSSLLSVSFFLADWQSTAITFSLICLHPYRRETSPREYLSVGLMLCDLHFVLTKCRVSDSHPI